MTTLLLAQAAGSTTTGGGEDIYFIWGCILFAAAVFLLFLELFVPSGGLIGILCGIATVGSVVAFFQYDPAWGIGTGLAYIVLAPIALVFIFKIWMNSPLARMMILGGNEDVSRDLDQAVAESEKQRQDRLARLRELIGAEGETVTALRPVGTVRINGQRIDALAESGVIDASTPVIVTDVYDNQIKVRVK